MKRSALNIMLRLIVLVKPLLLFMILAVWMGVIGNLMASFITVLGGYGILNILKGNEDLKIIFILLIVFALVRGFLRYGEQTCNHYIAFKLLALIREKVFRALRKLCPARLEVKNSGDLISLITSDIELLEVFYAHTVSPVSIAFIYSLIMVFFIGHYHLVLGLVALVAYIVIGLIIPVYVNSLVKNDGLLFRNAQGLLSSFVLDSLRGLREILQFNKGEKELNELDYRTNELLTLEERMKNKNAFNLSFTNTAIYLFDLIMMICASLLYFNNLISFEALIISVIALMSSFGPVVALASLGTTLPNTLAAGERVLDILDEKPLIEEVKNKENTVFNKLEAENIYFSYGDELILDDISLNIRKGETVGIEGRSGSGKSTLLKLFMRFWDINKGDIKISNKDIKEINTS
ncbi:MAG: ABC transporter transmembrane domain-containing protein, partial [Erysipelotrichaceae bacterium]